MIRPAKKTEAKQLSDLASRSKSHWPYEEEYLELVRATPHITPEDIRKWPTAVAVVEDEIAGFAGLAEIRGDKMLDHLWIDPKFIGKGLGSQLFHESIQMAQSLGWNKFRIASDPYAEDFYLKMGAKRVGDWPSKLKLDILFPLLEYGFVGEGF